MREKLKGILYINERPHKLALSFAAGIFIGISPFIGFHILLAIIFAWIFRLNRFVTTTGVFITNPWSLIPIYTFCIWIGTLVLGVEVTAVIDWNTFTLKQLFNELTVLVIPFFVGSAIVGGVLSTAAYFIVRMLLRKTRRSMPGVALGGAAIDDGNKGGGI